MGVWKTIHLFDYEMFRENIFNDLINDRKEFELICHDFLKLTPFIENGKSLSFDEKIHKIDNLYDRFRNITMKFDEDFNLRDLNDLEDEDQKISYLKTNFDSEYVRFINFLLFFKYADYIPFVIGGKGGIVSKFENDNSKGVRIISKLDSAFGQNYFSFEGMGITGWINAEEVRGLNMDLKNLKQKNKNHIKGFINLVKIASKENLGILMGADMINSAVYNRLPQNKLVNYNSYTDEEKKGLCFEE